jgi:hypothetical protein
MWRIRTHRLGIDQGSHVLFSDFEHNGEMWAGEGDREVRVWVAFSEPFLNPPAIQVGLTMWDMDHSTNPRMDISADDATEAGFHLVFRTWDDTRVARVRAGWTAIGEVTHEDDWDLSE